MKCPNQKLLQDLLIDGVPEPEKKRLVKHIETCAACSRVFFEYFVLEKAIKLLPENEECLSDDILEDYNFGTISVEEKKKADEHLKLCIKCRKLLDFQKDPSKISEWIEEERVLFEYVSAREIAKDISKRTVDRVFDRRIDFEMVWIDAIILVRNNWNRPISVWWDVEKDNLLNKYEIMFEKGGVDWLNAAKIVIVFLDTARKVVQGQIPNEEKHIRDDLQTGAKKLDIEPSLMSTSISLEPFFADRGSND